MTTYFKAVRPDGASFFNKDFQWNTEQGGATTHAAPVFGSRFASDYLSVSTSAADCVGFEWPCRLLEVEAVGKTFVPNAEELPNKVAGAAFRTVRELPAHEVFGPQGADVVALLERAGRLTADEAERLNTAWAAARGATRAAARAAGRDAAWDAAWDAVWAAAWDAAWDAVWAAARDAAWAAARDAAWALIMRDLITEEKFNALYGPWAEVMEGDEQE